MNIAELFIKIGLSGGDGVGKGLKKVHEAFKDVVSSSFQAKVAIAGALLALERMTAASARTGMELMKFSRSFGISLKGLQEWQYMARKFGAEDKVQPMVEGISRAITRMQLGEGMPKSFGLLGIETQGKDALDIMSQLSTKLKGIDKKIGLELVSDLGIDSEGYQALVSINELADKPNENKLISENEAKRLEKVYVSWSKIWAELKRIQNLFVANWLGDIVNVISDAVEMFADFVVWIGRGIEGFQIMKTVIIAVGLALMYAFMPVTAVIAGIIYLLSELKKFQEGKQGLGTEMSGLVSGARSGKNADKTFMGGLKTLGGRALDMLGMPSTEDMDNKRASQEILRNQTPLMLSGGGKGGTSNNTSNSNVFMIDGKDIGSSISDPAKKEFSNAYVLATGRR